jgi:HlyD family type I secretion membrane fusion protein
MSTADIVHDIDWYSDVPRSIRPHLVLGLVLGVVCLGGFGAWASLAPLKAAVISPGSFVATGENKVVQHLEGGIIEDLLVNEGDRVKAGEPIIKLDGTAAQVKQRQLFLRQARLEANVARLQAQAQGRPHVAFPEIVSSHTDDPEIQAIVESTKASFDSAKTRLQTEIGLLQQNVAALDFREEGFGRQRSSMQTQLGLLKEEYAGKLTLLSQGLIRATEVKAIQRAMADADGQIGRLDSEMSETKAQSDKYTQQAEQTTTELRQQALAELQTAESELDAVREQAREAKNVVKRSTINAPVDGVVVRMYYHTAGGVIESGKKIAEILPSDAPLIIETLVQRKDIDVVKLGQHATVRLSALNQRTTPVLNGEVYYVSADALTDATPDRMQEVYLARIKLSPEELHRVRNFSPTPGMPVEVMIQTAERTFLDYLTRPLRDSMNRAFMEQ